MVACWRRKNISPKYWGGSLIDDDQLIFLFLFLFCFCFVFVFECRCETRSRTYYYIQKQSRSRTCTITNPHLHLKTIPVSHLHNNKPAPTLKNRHLHYSGLEPPLLMGPNFFNHQLEGYVAIPFILLKGIADIKGFSRLHQIQFVSQAKANRGKASFHIFRLKYTKL